LEFCPGCIDHKPDHVGLNLNQISNNALLHSTSWPLLQLLTKDIYRPARMGVVFSGLYPKEYYDPFHSPQRVRNSVFRFNQWAEQNNCEFRVQIDGGDFQLLAPKGTSIICTKRIRPLENWKATLKVFKEKNQSRSFTSTEFADVVGLSQRGCLHILQKALASNKIQKIGHGKNSRYIFFSGRRAA